MKPQLQKRLQELFKEAYDREIERRTEAIDRQSAIITAYTVIGGLIAFYASSWPPVDGALSSVCFWVLFCLGCLAATLGFGLFTYWIQKGTEYHVLSTVKSLDEAITSTAAMLPDTEDGNCVGAVESSLAGQYRDCATVNQLANNRRDQRHNLIVRLGSGASVFLLSALIPYFFLKTDPPATSVIIQNPIRIMEPNNPQGSPQTNANPKDGASPQKSETASGAPKIEFKLPPPLRINESFGSEARPVREGEEDKAN